MNGCRIISLRSDEYLRHGGNIFLFNNAKNEVNIFFSHGEDFNLVEITSGSDVIPSRFES